MKLKIPSVLLNKQLTSLLGAGALAWGITLCSDSTALAWFDICNNSSSDVRASFAFYDTPDEREYCGFTGCVPVRGKTWLSQGWWKLSPGQCERVYHHELRRRNDTYYVHAEALDGSGTWGKDHNFCVIPYRDRYQLALADYRCEGGNKTEWRRFAKVYTGNARNFTYRLSD